MDVSSSECYTPDTNKLTCDATAELQTGLLGLKIVLISVASPVVEAFTLLFNRFVVPLGQAVSAGARVRKLCAAHYKNKSQQVCPIYETEDRTAYTYCVTANRLLTFLFVDWDLQQGVEGVVH